ncbi:MAG: T9SS type A sorting domain-containing protein [Bacteroidia bacterium]|nr:T9SS type A sorting domain-containing protein [Bacteroidia bacterium]
MKTKTITLLFFFIFSLGHSQLTFIKAPNFNGSTTQLRAPNGTIGHTILRGCFLITASELSSATNQTFQTFGFNLTAQGASVACPGTITIYFQNTSDATYLKGTNWTNVLTGMTNVYNGSMTVPAGTGSTVVTLTLNTPFAYSGTGLYVAYEWLSNGPFETSTVVATYEANNTLNPGGATGSSSVSGNPPASLANTAFRPAFNFGFVNNLTNEAGVEGIIAPGKISTMQNTPYTFSAVIKNNAGVAMNNITPTLQITGPTNFSATANITILMPGASHTVGFPAFNPNTLATGIHTVQVLLAPDQNTLNNLATVLNSVTCNEISNNPIVGSYTSSIGGGTNAIILSTKLRTTASASLTALRIAISTNTASGGNQVYGVLMNNTGSIIATSNSVFINPSMYGTFQTFSFTPAQIINPNTDYFIGMAQTQNTTTPYYPYAAQPSPFNPMQYYTSPISGGTLNPLLSNFGYFGIEAVFSGTCLVGNIDKAENLSSLEVFPNPAKDYIIIKNLQEPVRYGISDINGKVISSGSLTPEENKITLASLPKGFYMLNMVMPDGKKSAHKIIKE